MSETPKFAKFMARAEKASADPKTAELKKQALEILFAEYDKVKEKAIAQMKKNPAKAKELLTRETG